jgi:hypothetical protein
VDSNDVRDGNLVNPFKTSWDFDFDLTFIVTSMVQPDGMVVAPCLSHATRSLETRNQWTVFGFLDAMRRTTIEHDSSLNTTVHWCWRRLNMTVHCQARGCYDETGVYVTHVVVGAETRKQVFAT